MTSTKFMNAILSMDSYNRGYDEGIILSGDAVGTISVKKTVVDGELKNLDSSTIFFNSSSSEFLDQNIGFYALAYEDASGNTIISYRGTDDMDENILNRKDAVYGWSLGAGDEDSSQARMAIEFFNSVVGTGNDPQTANITTTGHSMGGGLAGLTASIYGKNASIYDSMHFVEGANDTTQYKVVLNNINNVMQTVYVAAADWNTYSPPAGWSIFSSDAPSTPDIYADTYLTNPDFSGVDSYRVTGEVLDSMIGYDGTTTSYTLNDGSALGAIDKHSMSTLVLRMYTEEIGAVKGSEWTIAEQYFWPALYDDALAENIGLKDNAQTSGDLNDSGDYSDILRTILAYSAIDGDQGQIRSFLKTSRTTTTQVLTVCLISQSVIVM